MYVVMFFEYQFFRIDIIQFENVIMFLDLAPARKSNVRNSPAKQNISRSINFIHEAQLLQVTNLIIFIL